MIDTAITIFISRLNLSNILYIYKYIKNLLYYDMYLVTSEFNSFISDFFPSFANSYRS